MVSAQIPILINYLHDRIPFGTATISKGKVVEIHLNSVILDELINQEIMIGTITNSNKELLGLGISFVPGKQKMLCLNCGREIEQQTYDDELFWTHSAGVGRFCPINVPRATPRLNS